ncbi:hypothetical protein TDB9533_02555 [Thalassocella blandensis]|nr:hypothetical protein TDB9533_02555 [Thalassocella blandensis]
METSLLMFFTMGFGLGMLHAFDPDHLAAVGGLSVGTTQQSCWKFAFFWSLGHGTILLLIAVLFFLVGIVIPSQVSMAAEHFVAFMLVFIGVWGGIKLYMSTVKKAQYRAVLNGSSWLVGGIHGTAGSASLLALIPLAKIESPMVAMGYVILFCLGVTLAMVSMGRLLGHVSRFLQRLSTYWERYMQAALALFSLSLGCYLVMSH